jgi:hypothetical protein
MDEKSPHSGLYDAIGSFHSQIVGSRPFFERHLKNPNRCSVTRPERLYLQDAGGT